MNTPNYSQESVALSADQHLSEARAKARANSIAINTPIDADLQIRKNKQEVDLALKERIEVIRRRRENHALHKILKDIAPNTVHAISTHRKDTNEFLKQNICIKEAKRPEIKADLVDAIRQFNLEKSIEKNVTLIIVLEMLLHEDVMHVEQTDDIKDHFARDPRFSTLDPNIIYQHIDEIFDMIVSNGYVVAANHEG